MPANDDCGGPIKRANFINRPQTSNCVDEWDTTYKTNFLCGLKRAAKKYENYKSPYRQQSRSSINATAQEEKRLRLATLQQPSVISEPLIRGLTNLCAVCAVGKVDKLFSRSHQWCLETRDPGVQCCFQCGKELLPKQCGQIDQMEQLGMDGLSLQCSICNPNSFNSMIMYSKDLPTVPRLPLPGDISEPKFVQLQARDWKGIPYPFADPRFDPFLPISLDASIAPTTLDPFKYCQRRRAFPQFHRCPNLPASAEALPISEPLGFTTLESKLYNRRWAKRRFPKPPEAFLTRLW